MRKLDELLQGVDIEWKTLSEIGEISGAGVDKKIIEGEKSIKLLNYMDIYRNKYITKDIPSMVVSASDIKIKQCNVLKGDIFFTPSSEVLNDIGKSSVALENIVGVVYSYHIMRLRLSNPNIITSMYVNYMLGSDNVQNQINKKAKGLTRFGLTKTQWQQIVIPIPCPDNPEKSLEIQQEIVRVLDELTTLTNQLTTELETERQNRKKQFEFFREQLFSFEKGETEWKSLGDVTKKTKNIRWNDTNDIFRYIDLSSVDKEKRIVVDTSIISSKNAPSRAQKIVFEDDIIFATTRPTQMRVCFITEEFSNQIASTGFCVLRAIKDIILPKWIFHQLTSNSFKKYLEENQAGIAYPAISDSKIKEFKIPIPVLAEQERIVKLLDQFDATHTAIEEEITKEIKLRTQQYEYYREKLLSFPQN